MAELFIQAMLGHLVGDYLLQSRKMALHKSLPGWLGWWWCIWHCLVYTAAVCLFLWTVNPLIISLIFLSHFPIDRWSLGARWLKVIRGRDFITAYQNKEQYWEVDLSFSCLVYAVVDNTMHLIFLCGIVHFI